MKKGYVINNYPNLIPSNYDFVYMVGMIGTEREPLLLSKWANIQHDKRGLIHQPALSVSNTEYDNASAFKWLLDDLGYSNWNNGNPVIVDIWGAKGEYQFNLDHIRVYGQYISDYFAAKLKPLLRLNVATWDAYLKNNRTEALRLLNNWELLLLQPGVSKPVSLSDYGLPAWWEYDFGLYKVDTTREWKIDESLPQPPVDDTEPTQPPETTQPPEQDLPIYSVPKKWKLSLFGGLIKGTLEADE